MPAYDYLCRTCGISFEVRRSLTDTARSTPCPHGHEETSRVFTAIALGGRAGAQTGSVPASSNAGAGCCGGGCCG